MLDHGHRAHGRPFMTDAAAAAAELLILFTASVNFTGQDPISTAMRLAYDRIRHIYVRSKADGIKGQLNLSHGSRHQKRDR